MLSVIILSVVLLSVVETLQLPLLLKIAIAVPGKSSEGKGPEQLTSLNSSLYQLLKIVFTVSPNKLPQ